MQFCAVTPNDLPHIEVLLDQCFGSDRQQRTAYRLRLGSTPIEGPTMVVRELGQIIASVQYWPVSLEDSSGRRVNLTLLGPIGVAPEARGRGVGVELIQHTLSIADAQNYGPIVLIGDAGYYGRFGFEGGATQLWSLPGPVDQHRVLLRNPARFDLPDEARLVAITDTGIVAPTV